MRQIARRREPQVESEVGQAIPHDAHCSREGKFVADEAEHTENKMKIEIKSRWGSTVLFTAEAASLLLAVQAAIKSGADLSRANLSGADLSRANLSGANLFGANLYRANLSRAKLVRCRLVRCQKWGHLRKHKTSIVSEGNIVELEEVL